jgi:phosphoribosyl 1,2-cyclic phosphate phosphodiesterase
MKLTFLGTGTSRGIPVIGCDCTVCHSSNPRNKRLRCSLLIESSAAVVIDTSVDFRAQMLTHRVRRLDAVVFTHSHADHILGLDDVYPFNLKSGKSIPVFGSPETLEQLKITFRYLFAEERYPGIPSLDLIPVNGAFEVGDLRFEPIEVFHGQMPVFGYRIGDFAYVTDVSYIPETSMEKLQGLKVLALDGLRHRRHPTHFSLTEAVGVTETLRPQKTYLVHMTHEVDHDEEESRLPNGVSLAYDGLTLEM